MTSDSRAGSARRHAAPDAAHERQAPERATLELDQLDGFELAAVVESALASRDGTASTLRALRAMLERGAARGGTVRPGAIVDAAIAALDATALRRVVRGADAARARVVRSSPDPARIVAQLVREALGRAPAGTRVELATRDEGGFACIDVIARGAALAPDARVAGERPLFEDVERAAPSALAIAGAIARSLGGRLTLGDARGATAVLALPAAPPVADRRPDAARAAPTTEARAPLAGRRVLIVDDDAPLARGLGRLIHGAGAHTTVSTSAVDGLRELDACAPDVLVTDFQLADGDGLALVRRAAQRSPPTHAVLITALVDPSLVALATSMGASAVVQKPFDPRRLVAILAAIFEGDG